MVTPDLLLYGAAQPGDRGALLTSGVAVCHIHTFLEKEYQNENSLT